MAKTLVIKGANFSANKLDTVVISDPVPCTAISLDEDTLEFTSAGDTKTLTATVTPSDTTDAVSWESSDTSVATVQNGVVTAVGLGEATITATCGSCSATCAVSVAHVFAGVGFYPGAYATGTSVADGGNGVLEVSDASSATPGYALYGDDSGTKRLQGTFGVDYVYPVKMPAGTKRLKVTRDDATIDYVSIRFLSTVESPSGHDEWALFVARVLKATVPFTNNVSIITVPEEQGHQIDSFVIGFSTTASEFSATDFAKITIEALPAEETEEAET